MTSFREGRIPAFALNACARRQSSQNVDVNAGEPADHLACGVAWQPAGASPVANDYLGRQRLMDVIDQGRSYRPAVQMHVLAAKLMGPRS
jgi:hypothetical protein